MHYDGFDERNNKNAFCTADEIDERQALELAIVLDRWQAGEIDPCDVILETSLITGARASFLILYHVARDFYAQSLDEFEKDFGEPVSDSDYRKIRQELEENFQKERARLLNVFRPEVLGISLDKNVVTKNIEDIRRRLESTEFDSWNAAIAIAEVLLIPPDNGDSDVGYHPLKDFRELLKKEKNYLVYKDRNIDKTISLFQPETEEDIKRPLAHLFSRRNAWISWKEKQEQEKYPGNTSFHYFSSYVWNTMAEKDPEFISPLNLPDRTLCRELEIVPSGTGLIEPYKRHEHDMSHEIRIYGKPVARITTYSISFVPQDPVDLELLRDIVQEAVKLLGDIPYKYDLPGDTPSGKSYERPAPTGNERYHPSDISAVTYVDTKDGKATPLTRFDLDDLWILYYLLEPIIEPNEQVAAAMNAARYAEERGAILTPDRLDYLNAGHAVENDLGHLKTADPGDVFTKALRDTFTAFALGRTDEAEFILCMSTLADHTLTGRLRDPQGSFPTFAQLVTDQRESKGAATRYSDALDARTRELVRYMIGVEPGSDEPLYPALIRAVRAVEHPLKEHFRQQARADVLQFWEDYRAKRRGDAAASQGKSFGDNLLRQLAENDRAMRISDAHAGYTPITEGPEGTRAVKQRINLVVADSAVETCLDGIHAEGRYISRMKGSPFVRKELPDALKPFAPQHDRHKSAQKVLSGPQAALDFRPR